MSGYGSYSIDQLWAMLEGEGGPDADRLIQAWKDTVEAVDGQMQIMVQARDELVRAWPPEGSTASQAFVKFVDDLIASMRLMVQAASDNYTAVKDISTTLTTAKGDIGQLREMLARTPPENKVNAMAFDPANPTNAGQRFHAQAWVIMDEVEATLVEDMGRMTPPPEYKLPDRVDLLIGVPQNGTGGAGTGQGGGGVRTATSGTVTGSGSDPAGVRIPDIPAPVMPPEGPTLAGGTSGAPGLGGPTVPGAVPGGGSTGSGGGAPGASGLGPAAFGYPGGADAQARWSPGSPGGGGRSLLAGAGRAAGGVRAGSPGEPVRGLPRSGAAGQRRREGERSGYELYDGILEEPWELDEGVAPVIEPVRWGDDHDPGPMVGDLR